MGDDGYGLVRGLTTKNGELRLDNEGINEGQLGHTISRIKREVA